MVVVPTVLTFVPIRYLYPSKNHLLWRTSWALSIVWFLLAIYLLLQEQPSQTLIWASLFYPVYYVIVSLYLDRQVRSGKLKPHDDDEY